jgi:hypothetical protein
LNFNEKGKKIGPHLNPRINWVNNIDSRERGGGLRLEEKTEKGSQEGF